MPADATVNTDLVIYDQLVQTAYLERVQDVLEVFNAQSQGALVLQNSIIPGDFSKSAFYQIGGSAVHRNVNSVTAVTAAIIEASEMVGVKAPWKYGPYQATEESFKRRARSLEEFSMLIGQDLADAALVYQISAAFAALVGSISGNAAMIATADFATDGKKVLTKGMRKFGDRFARIATFAMNAETYFDLVDDAITQKVYEEAGVVVYGGAPGSMGKPVLVSDTVPADVILGLQPGAVILTESQAPGFRSYAVNDQENLVMGYRAEGVFNVDVKGYSWDVGDSAPANPNLTQLGTVSNWVKHATSNKATAGVLIDLSGT